MNCKREHCLNVQGQQLEEILSAAGDYEIWLSTQLLQVESDEGTNGSQNIFDDDDHPLPFGLSELPTQPMAFDGAQYSISSQCLFSCYKINCNDIRQVITILHIEGRF